MASGTSNELSAAQRLMEQHGNHHVVVETVPDEEDLKHDAAMAAQASDAAGPVIADAPAASWVPAQGADENRPPVAQKIDTQSDESFPQLGGLKKASVNVPTWGAKAGGTAAANGSAPSAPAPAPVARPPPSINIPGRETSSITLDDNELLPRAQLKRPIPDIIKDINRKSRANISMVQAPGGRKVFRAAGSADAAQQALKELLQQIGAKVTLNVPIPQSVRPHIIGKQGATIKSLQEKTGARIQLPKVDEVADLDEDALINVLVEGNAQSTRAASEAILKIVGERSAGVNTRVRSVPAEFFPFIADPRRGLVPSLESSGVQVHVPSLPPRSAQPPVITDGLPVYTPSAEDHISLTGDREAVQAARTEIERLAAQLKEQLTLHEAEIPPGRQQFIIGGDHGIPMDQFYEDTGCVVILPQDSQDHTVAILGTPEQIGAGYDRVIDLAMGMQCSNYDISRFHRPATASAAAHARNVTRYLRQRNEIQRLEKEYQSLINTPFNQDGALPWELYSRDGKSAFRAQSEIKNIITSHPPSRMANVPVDPFYHQYLRSEVKPRVQQDFGVHLVVPDASDAGAPLLLVYEGASDDADAYTIPQTVPSAQEIAAFKAGVAAAEAHLRAVLAAQETLKAASIEVPLKFHDRLRKFIKEEQTNRPADQPRARVSSQGATVTIRGPASHVDSLLAKIGAFLEQEQEDEKERGHITTFDFPQAYANHLIGKGGSKIRELRDKFDVEIQVENGKVELKGPKAKAEKAKAHINSVARHLANEATHHLKIDTKFHGELIGAHGSTSNRLQQRYDVRIIFPRLAKAVPDDDSATDGASDAGKTRRPQAADEVIIRGQKKGADGARDELLSLYQYLKENSFKATLEVQQKHIPLLMGQGGSAMEAIRQATNATIDVPKNSGDAESMVEIQIKGTKENVAAAKKLLEAKTAVLNDTTVQTLDIPKKHHRALIGTGGSSLREMILKAGGPDDQRAVQFPKVGSDSTTVKVEGAAAFVDKMVALLSEAVAERESQVVEVLDVPQDKHKLLIGKDGAVRQAIQTDYNVVLQIPRRDSASTEVTITGQPADVAKAVEHVQSLIKEPHSVTVPVPCRLHHVISNRGQIFRDLRRDHHVTVDHAGHKIPKQPEVSAAPVTGSLPLITDDDELAEDAHAWQVVETSATEPGDIPWVLRGTPENVERAQKVLERALAQSGTGGGVTGYLVLPDTQLFRHVVGQGGKKIDSIRKQSGCRIHVPQNKSGQAIEVSGSKEGVEKARELILAAVKEGSSKRAQ